MPNLAPKNFADDTQAWHIDLATDYVTYFPADLGFAVGFLPRDFETDGLSPEDFVAEPVHFPAWGDVPGHEELARLCRIAAYLFGLRFIAHLEKRMARDSQPRPIQPQTINEDSTHAHETDIAAA